MTRLVFQAYPGFAAFALPPQCGGPTVIGLASETPLALKSLEGFLISQHTPDTASHTPYAANARQAMTVWEIIIAAEKPATSTAKILSPPFQKSTATTPAQNRKQDEITITEGIR